jgi:hypothetical protein
MNAVVFLGPTLSKDEAAEHLPATYLPPVAQGDVFRVAKDRPFAIGIVDGYFEHVPAVWHKEILWAMSRGVHVFGAASMGALRAAELSAFGMRGVGSIYEAFRSEELEDDDEVAVAHGDASTGYRATSEAMVNIRATLRRAEVEGVLSEAVRSRLEILAKRLFYPDRSYPYLFAKAVEDGESVQQIGRLRAFVANKRVDQKRLDALALLNAVKDCLATCAGPYQPTFAFAHTEAWARVVDWAECQPPILSHSEALSADSIAAEARLLPNKEGLWAAGLNRVAAGIVARRVGAADRERHAARLDRSIRRADGLEEGKAERFDRWLDERGLTAESYQGFIERQAELEWMRRSFCEEVNRRVVDELRMVGKYGPVARRALDKQRALEERGLAEPTMHDAGVGASELFSWYFESRMGRSVPAELEGGLPDIGIVDTGSLQREALREFLYLRLCPEAK